jgi:transketolase
MQSNDQEIHDRAQELRALTVQMVYEPKASHVASGLSMADLIATLYFHTLRISPQQPDWPERDRFILSKGHAAALLYATLAKRGFFPETDLQNYCGLGSKLTGHANSAVPGIEFSTGSLGHGLPVGCGVALAAKRDGQPQRIFVMVSDGELDEGSNWEAILFAPQHQLDNLVLIVDYNKIQSFGRTAEILDLEPMADKFRAFRWAVREIDGHNIQQIRQTFDSLPFEQNRPSVVIAHTVKGKGVSFMEDTLAWHYKSPNAEQLQSALAELEENA